MRRRRRPLRARGADRWRARILGHFLGQQVTMISPLAPREVERRINAASVSVWWSHYQPGVGGWARFGFVRLRAEGVHFSRDRPVLAGRIAADPPGSRLRLRYRAPLAAYLAVP